MKVKKYLSAFAAVGVVAFSFVACSDYDNGYNESAIQFTEEFKKAYGDIDPEQDWNLAERASVTVSTQSESNIKIYAQNGNEYAIVANYKGVSGTRVLGFDVVEGITNVIVSDGNSAQRVKIGALWAGHAYHLRGNHRQSDCEQVESTCYTQRWHHLSCISLRDKG